MQEYEQRMAAAGLAVERPGWRAATTSELDRLKPEPEVAQQQQGGAARGLLDTELPDPALTSLNTGYRDADDMDTL